MVGNGGADLPVGHEPGPGWMVAGFEGVMAGKDLFRSGAPVAHPASSRADNINNAMRSFVFISFSISKNSHELMTHSAVLRFHFDTFLFGGCYSQNKGSPVLSWQV